MKIRYLFRFFLSSGGGGRCSNYTAEDLAQDVIVKLIQTTQLEDDELKAVCKQVRRIALYEFYKRYHIEADDLSIASNGVCVELEPEIINALKKAIKEERDSLLRNVLREQVRLVVKALSPPLRIFPKSLHPVESLAR